MTSRLPAVLALALTGALALAALHAQAQGGLGAKALAKSDTNGDGKVSLSEFLAARGRIFDRIDANHDGSVTKEEVAAFQTHMENAAAGAMIRSGKERAGGGGGGQLGRLAQLTENGPVTRAQWDAMMTKRFNRIDTAHTGFITMDQMRPGRGADAGPPADPMAPTPPKF